MTFCILCRLLPRSELYKLFRPKLSKLMPRICKYAKEDYSNEAVLEEHEEHIEEMSRQTLHHLIRKCDMYFSSM